LDEAIPTLRSLVDLPDPAVIDSEKSLASDERESPELQKALLVEEQADRAVALANKDRFPDVTVSAGVMPRGGNFETMWVAGVGMNLPIWGSQKQHRAIAEFRARGEAARGGAEVIRRLLRQRVNERREALDAILATNRLYREGLLVQSEATVASTLAQYQVGRVSFASVLEALAGHLDDQDGYLQAIVAAQKIAIEAREISLESPEALIAGGMGKSPMPGAGSTLGGVSATKSPSGASPGDDPAAMPRM
jgi:outer membrane protein TolC